jgi:hypothetical protein
VIAATVIFVDDDFRRIPRTDRASFQRIITSGWYGMYKVSFKDKKINMEIKNRVTRSR